MLFSLAEMKTVKQVKGYLIIMVIIDYTLQHQREKSYIVQKLKQVKALTEHAQQHVTWIMASSPHFNHNGVGSNPTAATNVREISLWLGLA